MLSGGKPLFGTPSLVLPRRRRNFYQRPIGKRVAVVLSLAGLGLIYAGVTMPEYFSDTGW